MNLTHHLGIGPESVRGHHNRAGQDLLARSIGHFHDRGQISSFGDCDVHQPCWHQHVDGITCVHARKQVGKDAITLTTLNGVAPIDRVAWIVEVGDQVQVHTLAIGHPFH
jgi:hypothetical protein